MLNKINDELLTEMSQLLQVAADETRLKILLCLFEGEKCVSDIQCEINASQSLVSHQLKILRKANLVNSRKEKNYVYYYLDDEHVQLLISVAYQHAKEIYNEED